jgi:hypothetical protein
MPANAKAGVKAAPKKGSAPETALKLRLRNLTGDLFAGTVIATSNIALAVSFAAAIFQGDLAAGFAIGTWIMLLTMVVVGLAIGMLTTLPPIAGGPDTAVIAVIGLFAPAIAGPMLVSGVPLPDVLVHVMMVSRWLPSQVAQHCYCSAPPASANLSGSCPIRWWQGS